MSKAESTLLDAVAVLAERLDELRWKGGVWIEVHGAIRAVASKNTINMQASWRADVFYDRRKRKPDFSLVAETPGQLLRDLAAIIDQQLDRSDAH